jgi:excisionase family DNA binding protein
MDEWVSVEELAAQVKVTVQTIYNWHAAGKTPRASKVGRRLLFNRSDVNSWIRARAEPERRPA